MDLILVVYESVYKAYGGKQMHILFCIRWIYFLNMFKFLFSLFSTTVEQQALGTFMVLVWLELWVGL